MKLTFSRKQGSSHVNSVVTIHPNDIKIVAISIFGSLYIYNVAELDNKEA